MRVGDGVGEGCAQGGCGECLTGQVGPSGHKLSVGGMTPGGGQRTPVSAVTSPARLRRVAAETAVQGRELAGPQSGLRGPGEAVNTQEPALPWG